MDTISQSYCTLYIIRHGETEGNVKQLLQGHWDTPLTPLGKKQARDLAKKLSHIHFDTAFSSDLLRAQRTAKIITLERKITITTHQALRERSFGKFEGKEYKEFNRLRDLLTQFEKLSDKDKFRFKLHKEIESDEELVSRAIIFLREIAVAYSGKTILVVSHGGLMRALLIHLGFGTSSELPPGTVKNLAYIKLESDGVDFFIKETEGIEKKEWKFE